MFVEGVGLFHPLIDLFDGAAFTLELHDRRRCHLRVRVALKKSIIKKIRKWGFNPLNARFETCFGWDPQHPTVLGSDSKTHLTSRFWRHFGGKMGSDDARMCGWTNGLFVHVAVSVGRLLGVGFLWPEG